MDMGFSCEFGREYFLGGSRREIVRRPHLLRRPVTQL
jgi:hypothetical protein